MDKTVTRARFACRNRKKTEGIGAYRSNFGRWSWQNAHETVFQRNCFALHNRKKKLKGSEHFWQMKLTKCARDCSKSSICTSNPPNKLNESELFWRMRLAKFIDSLAPWFICSTVHWFMHSFIDLLVHWFIDSLAYWIVSVCVSVFLSTYLSVCLAVYLSVCLSICLAGWLSVSTGCRSVMS